MVTGLRTIASLLEEARAAESPERATGLMLAAADQASGFREWEAVLDALSALPSMLREQKVALVARARRAADTRHEIWGFRAVAVAEVYDLEDTDAAKSTLRAGERMLLQRANAGDALGFEWGVLAEAFDLALFDEGSTRRCLEAGWTLAWRNHDVENLGRLANHWATRVDRPEAKRRLADVEAAAVAWGDLSGLIYWWHALGDAAAGRRVRQTVLETTKVFVEALDLARYWTLYEKDSPGIEAAFARAEALASTGDEWLELATQARGTSEPGLARRALDHAADTATTPEARARIANAYVAWFDDTTAADRVGPRGLRPDARRTRRTTLDGWESSSSALFDELRARITPESLTAIAAADYGDDLEKHRAELVAICMTGLVPLELAWHPGEVVELTRWSSGDDVDHLARALCCVLLSLAARDSELISDGPILVESCLVLGVEVPRKAEQLLAWRYETEEPDAGESIVALFSLFLLRAAHAPDDPRLAGLLRTLLAEGDWVRGLREWMAGSIRADLWAKLVADIVPTVHETRPDLSPLLDALGFAREGVRLRSVDEDEHPS